MSCSSPTFGGINLEDIKAPECFEIEERLKKTCDIPVFHDDQHGTAIISGAALINAARDRGQEDRRGQGRVLRRRRRRHRLRQVLHLARRQAGRTCSMVDSKGVIYEGRTEGMNPYKERFAVDTDARTLADAMDGADVFVGVSVKGLVTKDMVKSMADDPIIFAMANPDPEITPRGRQRARPDVIMATGRSDYPNQVNNVLGLPLHLPRRARRARPRTSTRR